jgi:hypothetical protein
LIGDELSTPPFALPVMKTDYSALDASALALLGRGEAVAKSHLRLID